MILAMNGRDGEASEIVNATMPPAMAQNILPYLTQMDRLNPAQQAAAAHFGRFPNGQLAAKRKPVQVAAATPAAPPPAASSKRAASSQPSDRQPRRLRRRRPRRPAPGQSGQPMPSRVSQPRRRRRSANPPRPAHCRIADADAELAPQPAAPRPTAENPFPLQAVRRRRSCGSDRRRKIRSPLLRGQRQPLLRLSQHRGCADRRGIPGGSIGTNPAQSSRACRTGLLDCRHGPRYREQRLAIAVPQSPASRCGCPGIAERGCARPACFARRHRRVDRDSARGTEPARQCDRRRNARQIARRQAPRRRRRGCEARKGCGRRQKPRPKPTPRPRKKRPRKRRIRRASGFRSRPAPIPRRWRSIIIAIRQTQRRAVQGQIGRTAEWGQTRRLLVGPFANRKAAQDLARRL